MPAPTRSSEEIVRRFHEAFNDRDAEALVALTDPDIELHPTPVANSQGTYRGHGGLRAWLEEIRASGTEHRIQIEDIRRLDESQLLTVAEVRMEGEPVSPLTVLTRLTEAGKIVEVQAFLSDEQTLLEVGAIASGGGASEPGETG